jgi:hypothetical protein
MRPRRLVVIGVLAALAVLGALYGHDLRSWQNTLQTDELAYAQTPGRTLSTAAPTILPSSLSADLLSVQADRQWFVALPHFVGVYDFVNPLDHLGPGVYQIMDGAEADLTKATQDPNPAHASQAYDLLGVLYFRSAYPGSGTDPGLLEQAVSDLQNAVRVDPSNETAKENLELAIRVLIAKHGGQLKVPGSGTHATNKRRGSKSLPPGAGF